MRYKVLGRTGQNVSVYGLGGHEYRWGKYGGHLAKGRFTSYNPERLLVVRAAIEAGVNYFDTTYFEEVQSLGYHLAQLRVRDEVFVNGVIIDGLQRALEYRASHPGPHAIQSFVREELNTRLRLLRSDHFDCFMICNVGAGWNESLATEVLGLYHQLRDEGKMRFVGASVHSIPEALRLLALGIELDVIMLRYNYAIAQNWRNQSAELADVLAILQERNIGLVGMKSLCWFHYGVPFTASGPTDYDIAISLQNALAWQSQTGAPDVTVNGVETVGELESNLAGLDMSPDIDLLDSYLETSDRTDLILDNAQRHSPEITGYILNAIRRFVGQDLGGDLEAYRRYWQQKMNQRPLF